MVTETAVAFQIEGVVLELGLAGEPSSIQIDITGHGSRRAASTKASYSRSDVMILFIVAVRWGRGELEP